MSETCFCSCLSFCATVLADWRLVFVGDSGIKEMGTFIVNVESVKRLRVFGTRLLLIPMGLVGKSASADNLIFSLFAAALSFVGLFLGTQKDLHDLFLFGSILLLGAVDMCVSCFELALIFLLLWLGRLLVEFFLLHVLCKQMLLNCLIIVPLLVFKRTFMIYTLFFAPLPKIIFLFIFFFLRVARCATRFSTTTQEQKNKLMLFSVLLFHAPSHGP